MARSGTLGIRGKLFLASVALIRELVGLPFSIADWQWAKDLGLSHEAWPSFTRRIVLELVAFALAFGLLGSVPPGWRWVVAALSLVALAVLARVALRVLPAGGWMGRLAIGLIFGGAVGNLVDRARFGAVVDFVDVYWRGWHWPAFNVAGSAITVGVALLALRLLNDRSTPAPS